MLSPRCLNACSGVLLPGPVVWKPEVAVRVLAPSAGLDRQLLEAVRRQAHLSRGLPRETRRRRLVAWLQRRGHTWGTVSALIQELHI